MQKRGCENPSDHIVLDRLLQDGAVAIIGCISTQASYQATAGRAAPMKTTRACNLQVTHSMNRTFTIQLYPRALAWHVHRCPSCGSHWACDIDCCTDERRRGDALCIECVYAAAQTPSPTDLCGDCGVSRKAHGLGLGQIFTHGFVE